MRAFSIMLVPCLLVIFGVNQATAQKQKNYPPKLEGSEAVTYKKDSARRTATLHLSSGKKTSSLPSRPLCSSLVADGNRDRRNNSSNTVSIWQRVGWLRLLPIIVSQLATIRKPKNAWPTRSQQFVGFAVTPMN